MESTPDWNWIPNTKKKGKREMEPIGYDFEAVTVFFEYDKKDRSFFYVINYRRGNPDIVCIQNKRNQSKNRVEHEPRGRSLFAR